MRVKANAHQISKVVCIVAFLLLSAVARADLNETPKGTEWYIWSPFAFEGYRGEDDFKDYVGGQGYMKGFMKKDTTQDNNAECLLDLNVDGSATDEDFLGLIKAGQSESPGVILMCGHGGVDDQGYGTVAVEGYDDVSAAEQYWENHYKQAYPWPETNWGWTKETDNGLIMCRETFIEDHAELEDTECVVHVATCYGGHIADRFPNKGARVAIGPGLTLTRTHNRHAIITFGQSLAGFNGPAYRNVESAKSKVDDNSVYHILWGKGNTTLAPCIPAGAPSARYVCDDDNSECTATCGGGGVRFDTRMKEVDPMTVVDLEGCVEDDDVGMTWVESPEYHSITIVYRDPGSSGTATAIINHEHAVSANNERELDGNTEQDNAEGPNGDDFQWTISCTKGDCYTVP